jgi:hypothetical protein
MAEDRWSRPLARSELAGSAAGRLDLQHGYDDGVQRDRSDGTSEVARTLGGRLDRFLVHEDGTTKLVEGLEPTARYAWGRGLALAGVGLWVAALVGGFVFQPHNSDVWIGGTFVVGLLLVVVGSFAMNKGDLEARLRRRTGSDEGWIPFPPSLGGWTARSSAQLVTVIKLGDEDERRALVRDRDNGIAEVATKRNGYLYRDLVDRTGAVIREEVAPPSRRHLWGTRLMGAGVVLALVSLSGWLVAQAWAQAGQAWANRFDAVLGFGLTAVGVVTNLIGWRIQNDLRARLTTDDDPSQWFKVVSSQPEE